MDVDDAECSTVSWYRYDGVGHRRYVVKVDDPMLHLTAFERSRPHAFATLEEQGEYGQYLLSNRGKFNPTVIVCLS